MQISVIAVALAIAVAVVRLFCVERHNLNDLFSYQRNRICRVAAVVLVRDLENQLRAEAGLIRRKNRNFNLRTDCQFAY